MKVLVPFEILDANFVSSNIPETDYTEWSSATNYVADNYVMRSVSGTHRNYKCLQANSNRIPESNPAHWLDVGSTNRWRMLRTNSNIQSTRLSPIITNVQMPKRATAIGITRIDADIVTVTSDKGIVKTIDLRQRQSQNWSDYFFGAFSNRKNLIILDLPYTAPPQFQIKLEKLNGGVVSCGPVVFGNAIDLGLTQYDAETASRDFSGFDRNFAGDATLVKRRNVPTMSIKTVMGRSQYALAKNTVDSLPATIALYIGIDDPSDPFFDPLFILGLLKDQRMSIDNFSEVSLNMQVEGY